MIHVPSVAGTTRLSRDENGKRVLDRAFFENASQGYIAEIFDDRVVFSGINFFDDRVYPQYQYIINK